MDVEPVGPEGGGEDVAAGGGRIQVEVERRWPSAGKRRGGRPGLSKPESVEGHDIGWDPFPLRA